MDEKRTPLKRIMEDEGRRQSWLARRAGLDAATVSRIVTGRLIPTDRERTAIAEALGRDVAELWPEAETASAT